MKKILVLGLGGLGCPVAMALAAHPELDISIVEDDDVELSNLHRQILFDEKDLGNAKLEAGLQKLEQLPGKKAKFRGIPARAVPDNLLDFLDGIDLLIEGTDNFASKFLAADAAFLKAIPVVHGAALGLRGTVLYTAAQGKACYRCLFEEVPEGEAENCESGGVLGPVVGAIAGLMAESALRALLGSPLESGTLFQFDGRQQKLRQHRVSQRTDCPLCGTAPTIHRLESARYQAKSKVCLN